MVSRPRVFVSHSHKDNASTMRLVDDLRRAGADVWVDMADLRDSDFMERINDALAQCEWVVLVQTPNSLASRAVRMEINAALNLVIQQRVRAVIPFGVAKVNRRDVPATWATLHYYDGVKDYAAALAGLKQALGLLAVAPSEPTTSAPAALVAPVSTPPPPKKSSQIVEKPAQPTPKPVTPGSTARISRRAVIVGGLGAAGLATLSGIALAAEGHGWLKLASGSQKPTATPPLTPSPTTIPKIPAGTDTLFDIAIGLDGKSWYAVGKNGTILEWTSSAGRATLIKGVTTNDLNAITATRYGVWAVGDKGTILQRTGPEQWRVASGSPVTYTVPNDSTKYIPKLGSVVCVGTNSLLMTPKLLPSGNDFAYLNGAFSLLQNGLVQLPYPYGISGPMAVDGHADGTLYVGGPIGAAGQGHTSNSNVTLTGSILVERDTHGTWHNLVAHVPYGSWQNASLDSSITDIMVTAIGMYDARNGVALAQITKNGTTQSQALMVGKNGQWSLAVPDVSTLTHGTGFMHCSMVSPSLAWAVGGRGTIARYDGNTWSLVSQPDGQPNFNKVRAISASDAWAVGDNGVVFHWDGASWSPYT